MVIAPSLVLLAALVIPPAFDASPPQSPAAIQQSEQVRSGVQHFERAFYDLTPKKQDVEASREFNLAIAAFESEIAARPASATAHSYLGRIYGLRRDFKKSAAHYDRLSDLEPQNVDACVLAALAYAEDGQIAESRARLETAKARTSDPKALALIVGYIAKLDNLGKR